MSKRATKGKSLPWFRVFSKAFITETLGLNATETGIYIRLLAAMNEADEPINGSVLDILPRLLGVRRKTFETALETLIERGLIERLPDGLWASMMDDEQAFRDRNADKARTNSAKRWRKTQQNQSGSDANHTHTHREAPTGASQYEDNSEREDLDIKGSSSAYAGRPHTGGDEPPSFNSEVEEQPEWIAEIPMPKSPDDYLAGEKPFPADDHSSAGHKTTPTADADASDLQLLDRCEQQYDGLAEYYQFLVDDMRQTLNADHDLTAGQRRLLRDEILPLVRELERQPGPPEIAWESKGGENAANGETNAPAS